MSDISASQRPSTPRKRGNGAHLENSLHDTPIHGLVTDVVHGGTSLDVAESTRPDRESFCAVSSAFARKLFSVRSVLPKASLNDAFSPLQSTTATETNNNPAPAGGLEFATCTHQKATQREGPPLSDHALLGICVFSFQQVLLQPASQQQSNFLLPPRCWALASWREADNKKRSSRGAGAKRRRCLLAR
jgi:hypothetical protein